MTPKPIDSLTEQELRVECAEADGWRIAFPVTGTPQGFKSSRVEDQCPKVVPNYPASRDAVIEAILRKDAAFQSEFDDQLLLRADWAEPRTLIHAIEWARAFAATARKLKV